MSEVTGEGVIGEGRRSWSGAYSTAEVAGAALSPRGRQRSFQMPRQSGLPYAWQGGRPVIPEPSPTRSAQLALKRFLDIGLALMALLALALPLLGVAVAIKLTSTGPVLFTQWRPGLRGRPFKVFKFRTMYTEQEDRSGVTQTRPDDARVTPLGRFLRQKNIDELPQLINVLMGDMSIIGPRPHVANMLAAGRDYRELVPYYDLRLAMRPGLSGWAQAHGLRGPTDDADRARARIDHDIAYIQNFSIALDIWIILMTVRRECFSGSGF